MAMDLTPPARAASVETLRYLLAELRGEQPAEAPQVTVGAVASVALGILKAYAVRDSATTDEPVTDEQVRVYVEGVLEGLLVAAMDDGSPGAT